jgi:F-type H+-transporting ATPase subunit b
MQIISNIALISINETLIVQVISFLLFLFIINRIMFRPLRSAMSDRQRHIQQIEEDIASAQTKVASLSDQVKKKEVEVKKEAFSQTKQLEESATRQAAEIFTATSEKISAQRAKAQKEVDAQIMEARKFLVKESEILALSIMEKVLDRRLINEKG